MNSNQRIALAQKRLSVKVLGHLLDRHPGYISGVLSGQYKSPNIRKKICQILGRSEDYLWPNED